MVELRPVQVAVGETGEGCLVFSSDWLIGVLVRLSDQHEDAAGHWFLEVAFGPIRDFDHPIFPDLTSAQAWMNERLDEVVKRH